MPFQLIKKINSHKILYLYFVKCNRLDIKNCPNSFFNTFDSLLKFQESIHKQLSVTKAANLQLKVYPKKKKNRKKKYFYHF